MGLCPLAFAGIGRLRGATIGARPCLLLDVPPHAFINPSKSFYDVSAVSLIAKQ